MGISDPPDPARLHRDALVIDGHSDVPLDVVRRRGAGERDVLGRRHLPGWRAGGVDAAVLTIAGDESSPDAPAAYTEVALRALVDDIAERPDELALVTSAAELLAARTRNQFAILLNLEGARPLQGSLEALDRWYQEGIRFMTLTWNARNEVGTGVACAPEDGGLTPFGRRVLRRMAQLGMVADLSHASPATFWDAVREEPGNLVATHSNAARLRLHVRNLTDEQIKVIAAQDGTIGVCFYPGFLHADPPTVEHVVDHIAYIAELAGVEHVALGPDYIDFALEEIVQHLRTSGIDYGGSLAYPTGVEQVQTLENLTRALVRRGFAADEIAAILGTNLLRVIRRVADERGR